MNEVKREGNLWWDLPELADCNGVAAWCSKAEPRMFITEQVRADPCPFGEESRNNTTRNAATYSILEYSLIYSEMGGLLNPGLLNF